jgi:Aldo/keto reductase family
MTNRRELTGCFLTFSLAETTITTMTAAPSAGAAPAGGIAANEPGRTVKFKDGTVVPALGQGSARLGQGRHPETVEEEALREGISLGMTLIDTAEIYGNGDAEKLIGHVMRVGVNTYSWFPKCGRLMELKGPVRGVSRALGPTISTFTCCIGQTGLLTCRGW